MEMNSGVSDLFTGVALDLTPGWMNASGMLGFAPPPAWPLPVAPVAFVTNPISYKPRIPASSRDLIVYPGGALLHTGNPNPGFARVIQTYAKRWAQSGVPVWVHILGDEPVTVETMVRKLEETDGVGAIELGLPPTLNPADCLDLIHAAAGELPLVLNVPMDRIDSNWLRRVASIGVSAISLGAPRGAVRGLDVTLLEGRVYGPALLPQSLMAVKRLQEVGLPIIAGCGVFAEEDIHSLIQAGAASVQLDLVLWRGWEAKGN